MAYILIENLMYIMLQIIEIFIRYEKDKAIYAMTKDLKINVWEKISSSVTCDKICSNKKIPEPTHIFISFIMYCTLIPRHWKIVIGCLALC